MSIASSALELVGNTPLVRLDKLRGKVIFAWSVHEEGGLLGAAVLQQ